MNTPVAMATTRRLLSLRSVLLLAALVAGALLLWIGPVRWMSDMRYQKRGERKIKHMLLAIHNYHDVHNCLPPAIERDEKGAALCSGRVLLTPYLNNTPFYNRYDRKLPWNSPENDAVARSYNLAKSCFGREEADNRDEYCANFVFVTGPDTLFPDGKRREQRTFHDATDGANQTVLVVEIDQSDIQWHEPRDIRIDQMSFRINDPDRSKPCIGSRRHRGALVGMVDGSVHFLPESTPPETVKALLTPSGRERIPSQPSPRN